MKSRIPARLATLGSAAALVVTIAVVQPTALSSASAARPLEPSASQPSVADPVALAAPTAAGWINKMNTILDLSGSFFIADYGDPGYFNWSSDNCSWSPDSNPYGFKWACRRHDFGYRNLKGGESRYGRNMWNVNNKAVVDRQFHEDLYTHCHVEHNDSSGCRNAADVYHGIVSRTSPNTVGINRHTLVLP